VVFEGKGGEKARITNRLGGRGEELCQRGGERKEHLSLSSTEKTANLEGGGKKKNRSPGPFLVQGSRKELVLKK